MVRGIVRRTRLIRRSIWHGCLVYLVVKKLRKQQLRLETLRFKLKSVSLRKGSYSSNNSQVACMGGTVGMCKYLNKL